MTSPAPQATAKKRPWWHWPLFGIAGIVGLRLVGIALGLKPDDTQREQTQVAPEQPRQSAPQQVQHPAPPPREAPKPPPTMQVPIAKLLADYDGNELRSNGLYKGKWIETTGVVGDVKEGLLGGAYIIVGTGKQFEIPTVQCSLARGQEAVAGGLTKGQKVTVRGEVSGLMMNVQVKECQIVQ